MPKRKKYPRAGGLIRSYLANILFSTVALSLFTWGMMSINLYVSWLLSLTIVTYIIFRLDKQRARSNPRNRIPNFVLLTMLVMGGVLGGWLGMLTPPRHKTGEVRYWVVLIIAALLHGAALYLVL